MTKTKLSASQIFKNESKTFSLASYFFPKKVKRDVTILYAFVREPDNLVDIKNPDIKSFKKYVNETNKAFRKGVATNDTIYEFVKLAEKINIKQKWVEDFLSIMESDLKVKKYQTFKDLEKYIYGSAEVIGLFMARILDLPKEADKYALMMGRSYQLANIIRDIGQDLEIGRVYIPQEDIKKFGLKKIKPSNKSEEIKFEKLVEYEIERYQKITAEALKGLKYLPKRSQLAVKTASDMYSLALLEIKDNPLIVFKKQVRPKKIDVFKKAAINSIFIKLR